MTDVAIACEGVWKSYRIYHQRSHTLKERVLSRRNLYEDFWALRGIDLEVQAGTTMGIVGANGSGKSTLLKTLARILTPNKGTLTVNGRVSPLLELGTGFHSELTGRENVFLASSLLGQSRRQVEARYDAIVDFAGIPNFMDIPVKNYSSGMYARLAFAVAISVEPEILLVDEVLSVGDEEFQLRCFQRMAELRAQGVTVVLVTHSLATVRSLCAEAVWMDEGKARMVGPAADVVAGYLDAVRHDLAPGAAGPGGTGRSASDPSQAEITDVSFLDGHGEPAGGFRTGDPLTIRVRYRSRERLDDVSCGVAIHRSDNGAHVFGQNTAEARLALTLDGEGSVDFVVPSLPLLRGVYSVTVALHDTAVVNVYDWHERRYSFIVFDSPDLPPESGTVHLGSRWVASEKAKV
ncbi:MAG: ABC transporter ATP-binding protein [Acidimicrobiales bacterium]